MKPQNEIIRNLMDLVYLLDRRLLALETIQAERSRPFDFVPLPGGKIGVEYGAAPPLPDESLKTQAYFQSWTDALGSDPADPEDTPPRVSEG